MQIVRYVRSEPGTKLRGIDEDILNAIDVMFFLDKGVSLKEQGYGNLDYHTAKYIKMISKEESKKLRDKQNGGSLNGRL